jgi:hypothetical protein
MLEGEIRAGSADSGVADEVRHGLFGVPQRIRQLIDQGAQVDGDHTEVVGIATAPSESVNHSRGVCEQSPCFLKIKAEGAVEDFDVRILRSHCHADHCSANGRVEGYETVRIGHEFRDTPTCGSARRNDHSGDCRETIESGLQIGCVSLP